MGQTVRGIILGCAAPKGTHLYEDGEGSGLLNKWEAKKGSRRVYWTDDDVIGFWVMCPHGDERGCPDMDGKTFALDDIPASRGYKSAVKAWAEFIAWAAKQGVNLPPARLYFAETQVA